MAGIKDIKDFIEACVADVTEIETFVFDDLSAINTDRDKTYPVFLFKVPQLAKRREHRGANMDWKTYEVECFLFDKFHQDDTRELAEVWEEMQLYGEQVIIEMRTMPSLYRVRKDTPIEWRYGHFQHNDSLVGASFKLDLDVFHCYEAAVAPGNNRLLENGDFYLLENGDYKVLG